MSAWMVFFSLYAGIGLSFGVMTSAAAHSDNDLDWFSFLCAVVFSLFWPATIVLGIVCSILEFKRRRRLKQERKEANRKWIAIEGKFWKKPSRRDLIYHEREVYN